MKKTNEIKEKRETNVKHYKQKNGEIIAKVYSDAVNYYNKNENRYRQIDNHFKETKTNYQTKYNAFKVKIPKQINRKIYSIEKDDSLIEIDYDTKNNQIEIQKGKEKNESKAIIKQIEENANLEINLKGNKVKSNIILTKKGSSKNYEFFIKTKNLHRCLAAKIQIQKEFLTVSLCLPALQLQAVEVGGKIYHAVFLDDMAVLSCIHNHPLIFVH